MKRNMKSIIALLLCAATLFALCACTFSVSTSGALSVSEFEEKAEAFGLTVPALNNVPAAGVKDSAIVCKAEGSNVLWQVEYYILTSEAGAQAVFQNNMEAFKEDGGEGTLTNGVTKDTFEIVNNGQYRYLCRKGASFLYIDVEEAYASDVKSFVSQIGY